MRKVRIGVVGCGVIGKHHIQGGLNSPGVEITAVADINETAVRQVADKFEISKVYTRAEDLFADPQVEGVVLALQTSIRADLALGAFAAGKHVLIEKPPGMSAEEILKLMDAQGDRIVGCCSSRFRFYDSAVAASDFIKEGHLGDLRVIRCRNIVQAHPPKRTPPLWQYKKSLNGGGVMADWGIYDLDYIFGLTGWSLRPRQVLANAWPIAAPYQSYLAPGSDAETHVSALIACDGGTMISFERGIQVTSDTEHAWQITGSHGSLDLYLLPQEEKEIIFHGASTEQGVNLRTIWKGTEGWPGLHDHPIRDFAEAIREGRPAKTDLNQALMLQEIIDAIYLSADTGRAVDIVRRS